MLFIILGINAYAAPDSYPFSLTTTPDTTYFNFGIGAAGNFIIDWGDGTVEQFDKTSTGDAKYSHTYSVPGQYTIRIGGRATSYPTGNSNSAVFFSPFDGGTPESIASISGSIGAVFPTLGTTNSGQPSFRHLFQDAVNLTGQIPSGLFDGVTGSRTQMFEETFINCSGLSGEIPATLFSGVYGTANKMFYGTFQGCSGLTGYISPDLFANITTGGNELMKKLFYDATGLFTECPEDMEIYFTPFVDWGGGVVCVPRGSTINYCETFPFVINTVPNTRAFQFLISASGNFCIDWGDGNIESFSKGDTSNKFVKHSYDTPGEYTISIGGRAVKYSETGTNSAISFNNYQGGTPSAIATVSGSLGPIFPTLGTELSLIPSFKNLFRNAVNLTNIPEGLFRGITGSKINMFNGIFENCAGIKSDIPSSLFSDISGAPMKEMFLDAFKNCTGLTGYVSPNLFGNLETETTLTNVMKDIFSGASGLLSECPDGTLVATTGFEDTYFPQVAVCRLVHECPKGTEWYSESGECIKSCESARFLYGSNNYKFKLYGERMDWVERCLNAKFQSGEICYIYMKQGIGDMNILYDNVQWYANSVTK
ncbi:MAG: hypothetical protein IJ560_00435 [Alphaproteobacteria bacterium]|nr:hypothetical protein [Alphaproteobacteria bacterium]